jgi:hypothetical protein
MSKDISNTMLLALVIVLVGLAIFTLLPFSASKPNDLGYVSTCPFAPWSTLTLLLGAGVAWAIRQYLATRGDYTAPTGETSKRGAERPKQKPG